MILGTKQFVPRTKRDVYIGRHPNRGFIMKKKLAIIAMIVLLCTALVLCACDDTDKDGDSNGTPAACNCPNCHDGVCGCDQCIGDSDTPKPEYYENLKFRDAVNYDMDAGETAKFAVKNDYNGKYIVAIDTTAFEVYMDEQKATITADGFVVDVWEKGHTMKITNVSDQTKNLSFEFDIAISEFESTDNYTLRTDDMYIMRFIPEKTDMYTLACSTNENIIAIYEKHHELLVRPTTSVNFVESDVFDIFLTENGEYYVVTKNINGGVCDGSFKTEVSTKTIDGSGEMYISGGGNIQYFRFMTPNLDDLHDYEFTFTAEGTGIDDYFWLGLMDKDGKFLATEVYAKGIMKTYSIEPNTLYFIAVRPSISRNWTIEIK